MADSNALLNRLKMRIDVSRSTVLHLCLQTLTISQWYTHTHGKCPDLTAIARLVQTMLYGKRFFPYYS